MQAACKDLGEQAYVLVDSHKVAVRALACSSTAIPVCKQPLHATPLAALMTSYTHVLLLLIIAPPCLPPCSYIYSYPDLALEQTLAAGTDRAYSATCFSPDGTRLAAVGSSPDYLLTLWDWAAGATLLRCKAFSQEVYGLGFCPHSPGHLVSCGTGHIRFWKMASTFTGLKLQVKGRGRRSGRR